MQIMLLTKLKIAAVTLLLVGILDGGFLVPLAFSEPSAEKVQARTDHYGDPLPPGAIARLGTVRFRHPFWVNSLAFTPDGKTLASACYDGSVRLWEAATGKETRCFRRRPDPIPGRGQVAFIGVAVSPDGKMLIAAENRDTVYVWDMASGKELHRLKGGNGFSLALSPDGKTLAVGQGDRGREQPHLALWDLTTGKLSRQLGAAPRPAYALTFSPDGKVLAAGDCAAIGTGATKAEDGASMVRLWDAATGRQLREMKGHTGSVTAVAFSAEGRTLVSASYDATLRFWDPANGKQVRKIQVPDDTVSIFGPNMHKGITYGGVLAVAYSPDGRLLASGSFDGTVRLWDANSGKELHALRGHGREVTSVVFSPDGKLLASGSRDNTIRLWNPVSGKQLQPRQGQDGPVQNLAVSPDGRLAAVVCEDHIIRLWSLVTGQQLRVLRGHTDYVYPVAFSPDGDVLASGSADRTVRLWDAATGREIRRLPEHRSAVYSLAFPMRNMLVSGDANGTLHFWEETTGEELRQLPGIYSFHPALQLSSDGKILATASTNAVHLLNVKTGKELRRFGGFEPRFALSPDGRMLAVRVSQERKIRLWSIATGAELGVFADQDYPRARVGVASFVFSPDGRLLTRIGKDDSIELWEVLTGKVRRRFRGHQGGINLVVFSPDGKTLLSGSNDTTVLIWDVARQQAERAGWPSEMALQGVWRDLSDDDAEKADRAIRTLTAAADQSLPFLQRYLRPAKIADAERLLRRIADLDSDQFAVRERAAHELERLGEQAETALRQALKKSPSLEARRRMENLLGQLRGPPLTADLLRGLRAVEVLEHIGTPDAQEILKTLAKGASEARLTREAKASLERLAKRRTVKP